MTALQKIRRKYPKIKITEATENRTLTLTAEHQKIGKIKDYSACVASIGAISQFDLLDAFTSRSAIWFIWNKLKAEKYDLGHGLRDAVAVYDRTGKFELGIYPIYAPSLSPRTTQTNTIVKLLRDAGPTGVRRDVFLHEYQISQVGARIDELNKKGFSVESFKAKPCDNYVTYVLRSEPKIPLAPYKKRKYIKKKFTLQEGVREPFGRNEAA